MDEYFKKGSIEGISGATLCRLGDINLKRGTFYPQAIKFYKVMCDMAVENPYMPFINKLKYALENGVPAERIRKYMNNKINTSVDLEDIKNTVRYVSSAKKFEELTMTKANNKLVYSNSADKAA